MEVSRQRSVVLLLLIARLAPSSYAMSNRLNLEQKLWNDMHITKAPWKRDTAVCPTSYSSCAVSLNGGCCPTDRSCGTDSCYATTAAPATACSKSGYIACGIDQGGGCCPGGYSCANEGCIPLSGASDTQTCGTGSSSCAASLGGGCCRHNYACGDGGICYRTSFSSVSLTQTIVTTDSNAHSITITTTYVTAYQDTYTPLLTSPAASSAVAKVTATPTAVPKVDPLTPSRGLTQGQIGGIIAAAVSILVAILVAAFLIIRRLNAVVKVQKAARNSGSGTNTRSSKRNKPHRPPASTTNFDYDTLSVDPLMTTDNSTTHSHSVRLPRPSAVHSHASELDSAASATPNPDPYGSPFPLISGAGYQQVPLSEQNYFDTPPSRNPHNRNHSLDSESHSVSPNPGHYGSGGYFDPSDPALRDQNLRFGHFSPPTARPSVHGRQWSDASNVSAASGEGAAELEGGPVDERHGSVGSIASVMQRMGLSRSSRRPSFEGRRRSSSGSTTTAAVRQVGVYPSQGERLDRVQEASHIALDHILKKPKEEVIVRQTQVGSSSSSPRSQRGHPTGGKFREEGLGIDGVPPLERELERLDGQKFIGNIQDLLGRK